MEHLPIVVFSGKGDSGHVGQVASTAGPTCGWQTWSLFLKMWANGPAGELLPLYDPSASTGDMARLLCRPHLNPFDAVHMDVALLTYLNPLFIFFSGVGACTVYDAKRDYFCKCYSIYFFIFGLQQSVMVDGGFFQDQKKKKNSLGQTLINSRLSGQNITNDEDQQVSPLSLGFWLGSNWGTVTLMRLESFNKVTQN